MVWNGELDEDCCAADEADERSKHELDQPNKSKTNL